uniref:Non-structural protein n=1 Tax=Crimean-Congo hemorrhagic fever virus (strain Nigeria/IbAr10200/1970) TaxID=652961 RepID=NSS_CCHFI|nr:RecName: Full=Non-structural protein; Short=NSs [Crimean-Congo hemorrhagic fever virus strain IbAr10200]
MLSALALSTSSLCLSRYPLRASTVFLASSNIPFPSVSASLARPVATSAIPERPDLLMSPHGGLKAMMYLPLTNSLHQSTCSWLTGPRGFSSPPLFRIRFLLLIMSDSISLTDITISPGTLYSARTLLLRAAVLALTRKPMSFLHFKAACW